MLTPVHQNLLILQDRDTQRLSLEQQLRNVPAQTAHIRQKIAAEEAAIENARTELKQLETEKKIIETEIGSQETTAAKYKTQQNQVKKNDEYQALGNQIAETEKNIDALEEKELALLFRIDEAKARFTAAENTLKENISVHETRIKELAQLEQNLAAEHTAAQAAVAEARAPLPEPTLRVYDRIAARQQPVIVPLQNDTCGGCHLKVSSEIVSTARSKTTSDLALCDQCGRILYHE